MSDGPRYATFQDYLRVVRERRVLIVLVALLFAGAALAYSLRQDEVYAAEAAVHFQDINEELAPAGSVTPQVQTAEQRAALAAARINSPEVADRARRRRRRRRSAGRRAGSPSAPTR